MRLPVKAIYWGAACAAVICAIILQHGRLLRSSLESGRFENEYLAVIHGLENQIEAATIQMFGNKPVNLTVPSEQYLENLHQKQTDPEETKQDEPLSLTGIYLDNQSPLVEINGALFELGDQIGQFTVTQINLYQVTLSDIKNEQTTLTILRQ